MKNIYTDNTKGIENRKCKQIETLYSEEEQVRTEEYETLLRKSVHKQQNIIPKYELINSTNETKTVLFRGGNSSEARK